MPFTIVASTLDVFPTDISFGRPGGPEYNTDVVILESGHEQRNAFWGGEPRYSWDVGYGVRTIEKISVFYLFFRKHEGRHKAFRFKDWLDYKSCVVHEVPAFDDISLGAATAGQTSFQLVKIYPDSTESVVKPKGNSILIGEDGIEVFDGWTINEETGILTRATPLVGGEVITWGGEFYRKARFDTDKFNHSFEAWQAGGVEVPVIGLRGT